MLGVGVKNTGLDNSLRPSLFSNEMFIALDDAESILDPQGTDGKEVYGLVG